jgi:hypothetical protein
MSTCLSVCLSACRLSGPPEVRTSAVVSRTKETDMLPCCKVLCWVYRRHVTQKRKSKKDNYVQYKITKWKGLETWNTKILSSFRIRSCAGCYRFTDVSENVLSPFINVKWNFVLRKIQPVYLPEMSLNLYHITRGLYCRRRHVNLQI